MEIGADPLWPRSLGCRQAGCNGARDWFKHERDGSCNPCGVGHGCRISKLCYVFSRGEAKAAVGDRELRHRLDVFVAYSETLDRLECAGDSTVVRDGVLAGDSWRGCAKGGGCAWPRAVA